MQPEETLKPWTEQLETAFAPYPNFVQNVTKKIIELDAALVQAMQERADQEATLQTAMDAANAKLADHLAKSETASRIAAASLVATEAKLNALSSQEDESTQVSALFKTIEELKQTLNDTETRSASEVAALHEKLSHAIAEAHEFAKNAEQAVLGKLALEQAIEDANARVQISERSSEQVNAQYVSEQEALAAALAQVRESEFLVAQLKAQISAHADALTQAQVNAHAESQNILNAEATAMSMGAMAPQNIEIPSVDDAAVQEALEKLAHSEDLVAQAEIKIHELTAQLQLALAQVEGANSQVEALTAKLASALDQHAEAPRADSNLEAKLSDALYRAKNAEAKLEAALSAAEESFEDEESEDESVDQDQPKRVRTQRAPRVSKTAHLPERSVLLIDDAEINRVLTSHYFKGFPVKLEFAMSVEGAKEKCQNRKFDLILIDDELKTDDSDALKSSSPHLVVIQDLLGNRESRLARLKGYLWEATV